MYYVFCSHDFKGLYLKPAHYLLIQAFHNKQAIQPTSTVQLITVFIYLTFGYKECLMCIQNKRE